MNMDEHLEEIEDDFGVELLQPASSQANSEKRQEAPQASAKMPWLNANGIVVPKITTKKSRWSIEVTPASRASNFISTAKGKYGHNTADNKSKPLAPRAQAASSIPQGGFLPPQMYPFPQIPGMPFPPGMPPFLPPMASMIPPPSRIIPKIASPKRRSRSPYRHRYSRSPSPRRRSRSRSFSRSRSPARRYSRSPARRRSRSRYSSPRQRSPDILDGINLGDLTPEEKRKMEENKIFVKLLLTKLMAIKSDDRLENLHVSIMTIVKKSLDEERGTI